MTAQISANEQAYLDLIEQRVSVLSDFLSKSKIDISAEPKKLFDYLLRIKEIQGNFNNLMGFVACLLAKEYLFSKHNMAGFDVAAKPQGAPGLDIDQKTIEGQRVIAEIKTTKPYKKDDFGAAQKTNIQKDILKLTKENAEYKYLFVTDQKALEFLRQRYNSYFREIKLVSLTEIGEI